jgi:hypothetical protein
MNSSNRLYVCFLNANRDLVTQSVVKDQFSAS